MADTIKIAIAGPKTGPVTAYGDQLFGGAKLAIEQINAKGGVDGKMLEAKVYDDAADPKQAVAAATKVVDDGVKFVVGHITSSATQAASDIYEDEGVLMITPAATSPEITARGHRLIFRTFGLDSAQGPVAGNYIADHVKPKAVAVLHDKYQYGHGLAASVKQTLERQGVKVPVFEGINAGDRNVSSIIQKLKQSDVEFVYWGGYHPELGLLLDQARKEDLAARFMAAEVCANKAIPWITGGEAAGLLVTGPKSFDADPANKALVDAFEAKHQDPSGPYIFPTYSAVQVITEAIKQAGSSYDVKKIAEKIRQGTFHTPTGDLSLDEKGDLEDFRFVVHE
ncbi:high-affinity branched-chain amino acid ABC transporter substrate-binding protein [Streptomyces mirabilis]